MLGLWSKRLFTSQDCKGNGYLVFCDNGTPKVATTESYVLYTRDFKTYTVTKLDSNSSFFGSAVLNGQLFVWMHIYKGQYSNEINSQPKYEDVIYKVNEDGSFETVLSGRIAPENSTIALLNGYSGCFASNGQRVIGSWRNRYYGETSISSDFVNWGPLSGQETNEARRVSSPLYKDGVLYHVKGLGGGNCIIRRSYDGISWHDGNELGHGGNDYPTYLAACDSFFILTAGATNSNNYDETTRCSVSSDGVTWHSRSLPISMFAVPVAGKLFILLHDSKGRFVRATGIDSFTSVTPTFDGGGFPATAGHSIWAVDGGERLIFISQEEKKVYESADGLQFTSLGGIPLGLKPADDPFSPGIGIVHGLVEL